MYLHNQELTVYAPLPVAIATATPPYDTPIHQFINILTINVEDLIKYIHEPEVNTPRVLSLDLPLQDYYDIVQVKLERKIVCYY